MLCLSMKHILYFASILQHLADCGIEIAEEALSPSRFASSRWTQRLRTRPLLRCESASNPPVFLRSDQLYVSNLVESSSSTSGRSE